MIQWSDALCTLNSFWVSALNHVWQSTLFAGALALAVCALVSAPARIRHALCLIAISKFILVPGLVESVAKTIGLSMEWLFFDLIWLLDDPKWAIIERREQLFPAAAPSHSVVPLLLLSIWAIGTVLVFSGWIRRYRRFALVVSRAREVSRLRSTVKNLSSRIGMERNIRVLASSEFEEPGVWGSFSPAILLPSSVLATFTSAELNAVLSHELCHVKRRDNLLAHILGAVCGLFWFHPLVWWLDRRILAERELICDAHAVQTVSSPVDYRNGLLKVLHQGTGFSLAGISCAGGGNLSQRIARLANVRFGQPGLLESFQILIPAFALLVLFVLTLVVTPVLPCAGGIFLTLTEPQVTNK